MAGGAEDGCYLFVVDVQLPPTLMHHRKLLGPVYAHCQVLTVMRQ